MEENNNNNNKTIWIAGLIAVAVLAYIFFMRGDNGSETAGEGNKMTFFVTSKNPGQGANLGGLAGADKYCQSLAESAGAGSLTWRAYLSTQSSGSVPPANARDRIGSGPWHNAKGVLIAKNLSDLHSVGNMMNKETALDEKGEMVMGRGDAMNLHDILTGSMPDGTASTTKSDTTCGNWTSGAAGSAIVGHHDRVGLNESDAAKSWNSSHLSRGCSLDNLKSTGGGGLLYCFASK